MAGSMADYLEQEVLDDLFGIGAYSPPGTVYLALSTADPTDAGTSIAEPFGNAYARVSITNDNTEWTRAGSTIDNDNDLSFPEATGSWGTISHFAVFDQDRTDHAITDVDTGTKTFTVAGDQTSELAAGTLLSVNGSTGNDGNYTVVSSTYDVDHTDIVVSEVVSDATVDGTLYPMGNPLYHGSWDAAKEYVSGDTAKIAAGDLDISLA